MLNKIKNLNPIYIIILLLGFTYFSKDDVADEDWNELNLYFVICCLTWRWW